MRRSRARASALRERRTRVGAGGTRDARAVAAVAGLRRACCTAHAASSSACATCTRRHTGRFAARRRRTTRRTKTSIWPAAISCSSPRPAWSPRRARSARIALGPLAGQPVSRCHTRVFPAMAKALVARAGSPGRDRHAVHRDGQRGCHSARRDAWRAPRAHALVHESRAGDPLPLHCGLCSKCRERRDAFAAAGLSDPARYEHPSPR